MAVLGRASATGGGHRYGSGPGQAVASYRRICTSLRVAAYFGTGAVVRASLAGNDAVVRAR
eukprot:2271102-Rhodomonas_salina.1